MKLIQPFEALLRNGVTLTFKVAAAGDQIQLDILPAGKDTKTGVALPARALLGTAAELDANLEAFLEKYAGSVTRIADVVASADQELQAVEAAASTAARKAVEDKRAAKTPGKTQAKGAGTPKTRDLSAGLTGDDEDDGQPDACDGASTTLDTASASGSPSGEADEKQAPGGTGGDSGGQTPTALSAALF